MSIEIATADDIKAVLENQAAMIKKMDAMQAILTQQAKDALPEWVSVKQAAEYLSVTPATIRRQCRSGLYDTRRNGGKNILISRNSLLSKAA